VGHSSRIVRYRVKSGRLRGLEGDGCKFKDGKIVFCHPDISNPKFTEHFWPVQLIPLDYVNGKRHHKNSHLYGDGTLVNVPYFTRGTLDSRIEGEKVNYIEILENYIKVHIQTQKGSQPAGKPTPRGKIQSFSTKSRARMIQLMASLTIPPNLWCDFTFSDDVMMGLNESERAKLSSQKMDKFEKWFLKKYPIGFMVWRRDWELRKSGSLKGQLCPHFHVLFYIPDLTPKNHVVTSLSMLGHWVAITGTNNPKALKVAMHEKSYRLIDSLKMAQVYVSKYVAKKEYHKIDDDISLGRFWGKVGLLPIGKTTYEKLTESEEVLLRRFLRRYVKDKRFKRLVKSDGGFWLLVNRRTIARLMDFIRQINTSKAMDFAFP